MFDAAGLVGPLPEGSFFALLAEHGERIVRDEDFAECYSQRMGRPSIPPSLLAKILLLEYRCGLSDEAAMEHVPGAPCDSNVSRPENLERHNRGVDQVPQLVRKKPEPLGVSRAARRSAASY